MKILISSVIFLVIAFVILSASSTFFLAKGIELAVGAPVHIDKFKLNPFSQQLGIYGLQVKNPPGFNEPVLASIPEIFIHLDLGALSKKLIHIREIHLNLDEITVERTADGKVNLTEIGAVKKSKAQPAAPGEPSRPAEPAGKAGEPAKPTHVQIDTVVLSLGRARYVDPVMGEKKIALDVKESVLKNVTDPAQITQQIVYKTLQGVGLGALTDELKRMGVDLDLQGGAADQVKQVLGDLAEKFKF